MIKKIKKIISIADIHFPSLKNIEDLERQLDKFYIEVERIIEEVGDKNAVRITILGDIFHNKISVTNESNLAVYRFLKRCNDLCKTIVIIGNHDYIMDNTNRIDSLSPLFEIADLPNVVFLDERLGKQSGCYVDSNIVWCLFSSFSNFLAPDIKSQQITNPKTEYKYFGLIHGEINGASTAVNHVSENSLTPSLFEGCDAVIAGHIHKKQVIDDLGFPIIYCGSLKQQNLGETPDGHGYLEWTLNDDNTFEYKHVDIPDEEGGYYKFSINSAEDFDEDKEILTNKGN